MSFSIPLDIQEEVIKRFPVKSLLQFRCVSKHWKSFINSPEFIKTYHINHPNPQHHLLVQCKVDIVRTYTSIIDDITFPQQKFPLTTPEPLNLLRYTRILGCVDGLLCFDGWYKGNKMVVLWNPSIRKSIGIPIPNGYSRLGFGVSRDTSDPKLVKINVYETLNICWEVQVYTLSSRVWKNVYTGASFKPCHLFLDHVFVSGFIYWRSIGSFLISFDLKSEKFGEVCIPERLICSNDLWVAKVNESLGLLEYYHEGEIMVCGVWMRKDDVNQLFTKIYTIKVEGKSVLNTSVLGFRNNGDVVLRILSDDYQESTIEVYEPSSGHISGVGIRGVYYLMFSTSSYMETLLLLDQPNSIIQ